MVLFSAAIDGALEGDPINVVIPEDDAGASGGCCERLARGEIPVERRDLGGVRVLLSEEEDAGDVRGSRGRSSREEILVDREDLVCVRAGRVSRFLLLG